MSIWEYGQSWCWIAQCENSYMLPCVPVFSQSSTFRNSPSIRNISGCLSFEIFWVGCQSHWPWLDGTKSYTDIPCLIPSPFTGPPSHALRSQQLQLLLRTKRRVLCKSKPQLLLSNKSTRGCQRTTGVLNETLLGWRKIGEMPFWKRLFKCLCECPIFSKKVSPHKSTVSSVSTVYRQVCPTPHVLHELGLVLEAIQRPRDHQIHLDSIAFPVPRARTWQSNSGLQRKTHGFHVCCHCHVST